MVTAFSPPETMTNDDIRRVADVRRAVWTGGFKGVFTGTVVGSGAFYVYSRYYPEKSKIKSRNMMFLFAMGGGAAFSFLFALTAGKNSVQHIGDVFRRNAHEWQEKDDLSEPSRSTYQIISERNQQDIHDRESHFLRRKEALDKYKGGGNSNDDGDDSEKTKRPPQPRPWF